LKQIDQTLEEIVDGLSPLDVEWMDEAAGEVLAKLATLPKKTTYTEHDVATLFDGKFDVGILCARTFLALSKDIMDAELRRVLGKGNTGATFFKKDQTAFLKGLTELGLLEAMAEAVNYTPVWSDILKERLRSGRGSAIQGQKRGRGLEDFAEAIVKEVFGEGSYEVRCTFVGATGETAKCDIAIPGKARPRIVIESKAYAATGSKMTDIIGDLDAIIKAKRHDTTLLFVTDGTSWNARLSDLRKIVSRQNAGSIARIYTTKMQEQLVEDLRTLKGEAGL
jgi:hypothetical protein